MSRAPTPELTRVRLVCPACHGGLERQADRGLSCLGCGAGYPVRASVDVLLDEAEWEHCREHVDEERAINEVYSSTRRHSKLNLLYYDWWVGQILARAPREADRFLELMCGEAEISRRLGNRFGSSLALDINVEMVEQAAAQIPGAREGSLQLVCGSARRLPLPDASIDVIGIQGGLHHVRAQLETVLREIGRVLRPGGVVVASEPANDNGMIRRIRQWQYARSEMQGHDPEEDGFTRQELRDRFDAVGITLESYERFGHIAYPLLGTMEVLPLLSRFRSTTLARSLIALDRLLAWLPVTRAFGFASLFVARRR